MATEGRGDRLTVVALDLGTTFSGYAFSHRSDFQINPMKILSNDWSAEGVHNAELKAPSVLLLNPDQSFKAFGYRAQSEYGNLVEEEREVAAEYYYVKNFKMQLHNMVKRFIIIFPHSVARLELLKFDKHMFIGPCRSKIPI